MTANLPRAIGCLSFLTILTGGPALAQSSLNCDIDGDFLPVFEIKGRMPYCFTGDDLVKGEPEALTMLPTSKFGEGFIEVSVVKNERRGVVSQDGLLRFTSRQARYRLHAKIVSQTDLSNCYFAMRFDTYGKMSYLCNSLGDLEAGKVYSLDISTKLGYEMPQQLHIFSGMEEIRTSLVPIAYDYEEGVFRLAFEAP